jgi:hypothetical protein
METKWISLIIIVWVASIFGGMAYSEYSNNQCKVAAIAQGMSADDIIKLCK